MHFAPGLRPGTPCSQSGYSRTLPTARAVNLQIWPRTSGTPSLLGKNLCPSLVKRKNRHRSPAETVTHWAPFCPKLVKKGPKNDEPSGDSRTPRHVRALVSMDSVRLYDLFSGKIEAERSREGCPLTFRPSKVGTFGDRAQKTRSRQGIAELPDMIGHWFQWI